ncbi:HIG1 domain-containing protein [Litorimonas sp. RW-G-Af-16]|uniref:HIG1 domain-containing protein n=1 Tax=Litorimonas sp. RW-G-Af-16 TaxID=3241168 RepID=UPI00390CB1A2
MLTFLYVLTGIAFAFVLLTLIAGAIKLGGNKEGDRDKSNIWMRRRVMGQVVAVGLLMLTLFVKTKGG